MSSVSATPKKQPTVKRSNVSTPHSKKKGQSKTSTPLLSAKKQSKANNDSFKKTLFAADDVDVDYNSEEDSDYIPESEEDGLDFDVEEQEDEACHDISKFIEECNLEEKPNDSKKEMIKEHTPLNLSAHRNFSSFIHRHEIPRKFLHVSIGFITLYFYTLNWNTQMFIPYLSTACAIIFSLDLIRFRYPFFNSLYCETMGFLMREKEIKTYNGVIWYLLGLSISFQLFPKDIGVMAVLLLSWSDTAASTFGRLWGHLTPKITSHKSWAGTIAAFITGILSFYVWYGYFIPTYKFTEGIMWTEETSYMSEHVYAVACGFVAALSEGIELFDWDDNFTIPTLSSVFLYALIYLTRK